MSDTETDAADQANKAICDRLEAILDELREIRSDISRTNERVSRFIQQLPNIIYRNVRLGG